MMNQHVFGLLIAQIWQIATLAIAVTVIVRLVAKNRPHLAHTLWMLVLIKCVTPPLWGHSLGVFSQLQANFAPDESAATAIEPETNTAPLDVAAITMSAPNVDTLSAEDRSLEFVKHDELVSDLETEFQTDVGTFEQNATASAYDETSSAITPAIVDASEATADHTHCKSVLIAAIFTGSAITLLIMVFRCLGCLRLIHRQRTTEFDEPLQNRIQQLSKQLRIRRTPQIIVSDVLFGPAVLGVVRHTIVLPRCLFEIMEGPISKIVPSPLGTGEKVADRPDEGSDHEPTAVDAQLQFLDPILAHELLHIRRGDLRTGTLQAIVQSLWWFHPAVWFANRWLSREAEHCCDEQVIAELGCTPGQYARSLLSVIECKHRLQPIPVFPGMKPVEITTQRMERIMSLKNGLKKRTPLWCWLMIVALAFVVLPGAVAKPTPDEKPPVAIASGNDAKARETVDASAPQVEVSTETYKVGDLFERLAEEHGLSSDEAPNSLIRIFEKAIPPVIEMPQEFPGAPKVAASPSLPAIPAPRHLSSISLDGDVVVVVQSDTGHAKLKEEIDRFRKFGFKRFQVTARFIMGSAEEINALMSSLKMDAPFSNIKKTPIVATNGKATDGAKSEHPAVTTYRMGPIDIVSRDKARAIEELARSKSDGLAVKCPQVEAFNGQTAMTHAGETKRYVVGFNENDEPMINTIVEGPAFRVTPTKVEGGLLRLQCVSSLVGVTEMQTVSTSKRDTESPQRIQLPASAPRRVQSTVELQDDQTLLLTGLTTTEAGTSEAVLVILDAIPVSLKSLMTNGAIEEPSEEAVNEKHEPVAAVKEPIAVAERLMLASYPVADLVVRGIPVITAVSRTEDNDRGAAQGVIPVSTSTVAPENSSGRSAPEPKSQPKDGSDIRMVAGSSINFAPFTELIKATVQPESWAFEGHGSIAFDEESLSLVIKQTRTAHDEICELLSRLRNDQDANVRIQCRIVQLTKDSQTTWLEKQCSLHPLKQGAQWGLLPQQRSEAFTQALLEQIPDVIFVPTVMTISGQAAMIAMGGPASDGTAPTSIRLEMTPHLLPESKVIRLQHAFSIGAFDDEMPSPVESLVGSGQTLLLLIDAPEENEHATPEKSRYLLMMTPEHMPQKEEVEKVVNPE